VRAVVYTWLTLGNQRREEGPNYGETHAQKKKKTDKERRTVNKPSLQ
jgi:hypothetical protein